MSNPKKPEERTEKRTKTHARDLISRRAAIDALSCINPTEPYLHYDDAVEAIKALPSAQPEPRWIPCNERLPEEYGEYRITWITSASRKRFIGDAEFEATRVWDNEHDRFKGEWLLDDYIKNNPDVKVLAWKPLEEPWRGE